MLRHLGYVAINLTLDDVKFRTCRLANATPDRLRELIASNLTVLQRIIAFNAAQDIHMYRITSEIIPFASHPINDLAWWDEFEPELSTIGALIRNSDMRVSMHPGQYVVLNSPRPDVVANALSDLTWHVRFLDALGVDTSCKVNIHMGGIYGDRDAAIERFIAMVNTLPGAITRRLTIENDDRSYTALDVLRASAGTGLPVVFDWLHHNANREPQTDTDDIIARCFDTWQAADGPPKTHYSTQADGKRPGAHADYIDAEDFVQFLNAAPDLPFDCMLEAKAKDLALFRLRESLTGSSALGLLSDDLGFA